MAFLLKKKKKKPEMQKQLLGTLVRGLGFRVQGLLFIGFRDAACHAEEA